jgi:peptide/nickel transport system ATP-binding protein
VVFDGAPLPLVLKERPKEVLRRIQLIYQTPDTAMNPRHTVRETIGRPLEFYLGLKGAALDRRVSELLRLIEMDDSYMDRLPEELSGGQKQRVCIARGLAASPELVICDEVTSALDTIVQAEILKLLMLLQKELGITYIFITHDIATVRAVADEIVVMYQGKVVERGLAAEVLSTPRQAYTERLISSVPQMDPDWLTKLLERREKIRATEVV